MLDSTLRPVKDAVLQPVAAGPCAKVCPILISTVGLVAALGAGMAAWRGWVIVSVVAWLASRVLDGLDGAVARANGRQSDIGGLLDFLFDTIGYIAIPLGIAFGVGDDTLWTVTAMLLGAFYLNAVSLGHVAAVLEKRGRGAAALGEQTSTTLPRGLVEGTETIVFFTIALAVPSAATIVWTVMAIAVVVTVAERTRWAATQFGMRSMEVT